MNWRKLKIHLRCVLVHSWTVLAYKNRLLLNVIFKSAFSKVHRAKSRQRNSLLEILHHACPCEFLSSLLLIERMREIVTWATPLFHLRSDLKPVVFIPINTLSTGVHNALLASAALHRQSFTREWVSNKPSNIPTFPITVERPSFVLLIYLIQCTAAEQILLKWLRVTDKQIFFSLKLMRFLESRLGLIIIRSVMVIFIRCLLSREI